MRIGRTLPPAAAPLGWRDIVGGLKGMSRGTREKQRFETELKQAFGVAHCVLTSSGKAALAVILESLQELRPDRNRVLIPAFTCYSVPSAIVRAGLEVHLCDVDPSTLDFDFRELEKKLDDPRLLCVVPVHLFGLPADVERVRAMVKDPEVFVVEDAAQAMGGESVGSKLGTLGDVGFFSLGRGKALSTIEGGVILTKRGDIGCILNNRVNRLEAYSPFETLMLLCYALALTVLTRPALFWIPKALPFLRLGETIYDPGFRMRRMSGLQAGLARDWSKRLAKLQGIRRAGVREWRERDLPTVSMNGEATSLLRYPVLLKTEAASQGIRLHGEEQGLGIGAVYPDSVHRIPGLINYFTGQDFPGASALARKMVTFPVHGFVEGDDRKRILKLLSKVDSIELQMSNQVVRESPTR